MVERKRSRSLKQFFEIRIIKCTRQEVRNAVSKASKRHKNNLRKRLRCPTETEDVDSRSRRSDASTSTLLWKHSLYLFSVHFE